MVYYDMIGLIVHLLNLLYGIIGCTGERNQFICVHAYDKSLLMLLTTSAMVIVLTWIFIPLWRRSKVAPDPRTSSRRLQLTSSVDPYYVLVQASSCVYVVQVAFLTVHRVVVARWKENRTFACEYYSSG